MTPQEFVTKVYNVQEGVIFDDLWPIDDKYKEVLYQANLIIDEFTSSYEWSFLREGVVLGDTVPTHMNARRVMKFMLPDYVDRVSTLNGDGLRLFRGHKNCGCHHSCDCLKYHIDESDYILIPFASKGYTPSRKFLEHSADVVARTYGNYLELSRPLYGNELRRIVVCDCQIKMPHLHICNDKCTDIKGKTPSYDPDDYRPCKHIEHSIFNDRIRNFMIYKTAYSTAKYSPIAGGIRNELLDIAGKELSKIKSLDADATTPDIVYRPFNFKVRSVY